MRKSRGQPLIDSYIMLRYLNITTHAVESHQGFLMRKDFIFIQIIHMVSQSIDEKYQLEPVFYMAMQNAPTMAKPSSCTNWISYVTSPFFVTSTPFTFICLLPIIHSINHSITQQIFIESFLKWQALCRAQWSGAHKDSVCTLAKHSRRIWLNTSNCNDV